MLFLALAIVCSALLPVLFRAFSELQVHVVSAIPANYLACTILGAFLAMDRLDLAMLITQRWLALAILQGLILAGNFYLLAHTAQRAGVAVAALASRVSVAIPVVVGLAVFGDAMTTMKSIGLAGALASLYLSTEARGSRLLARSHRVLPVVLFFSFGSYFTLLKIAQAYYLELESYHLYVTSAFFFALVASLPALVWASARDRGGFFPAHWLWGSLLGLLNYGAVYFLVRVLSLDSWESSQVYPIYSVGVVLLSTLLAAVLFREKLSRRKLHGLVIGIASVALLNR